MEETPDNANAPESGKSFVKEEGFAAVPIHFRKGTKRIKLVLPGVEPPLMYLEVTGDSADVAEIREVEGPVASVHNNMADKLSEDETPNQEEGDFKVEVGMKDNPKEPVAWLTKEGEQNIAVVPGEEQDPEEAISEAKAKHKGYELSGGPKEPESKEVDYPHEDSAGNPVSGFLLKKGPSPDVKVIRPEKGESVEESIERVKKQSAGYEVGDLAAASKLLGHSPLTKEDN